jgi:hypothetical protein
MQVKIYFAQKYLVCITFKLAWYLKYLRIIFIIYMTYLIILLNKKQPELLKDIGIHKEIRWTVFLQLMTMTGFEIAPMGEEGVGNSAPVVY